MGNIRDHEQISLDETVNSCAKRSTHPGILNNLTFGFVRPYMILDGKNMIFTSGFVTKPDKPLEARKISPINL